MSSPVHRLAGRRRRPSITVGVLVLSAVVAACNRSGQPAETTSSQPSEITARAERRDFARTVRVSGLVAASRSYAVSAPRMAGTGTGTLVVTRLVPSGTVVKPGDLLVEFDRQAQIKNANDRRAEYLDFLAQIRKKEAEQSAAKARDESDLKQAENAVERAKLEQLKNEFSSAIDAEKNDQRFEESKANLEQLRQTFQLKRRAAEAELRILQIQCDRAKAAMSNAEANAKKLTIVSPIGGLVVPKQIFKSGMMQMGQVQEGEEVRPGVPIIEVVDATAMEVRAKINQADFSYMRIGQPAEIRLDAYPGKVFRGRLSQLGPIGVTSDMTPRVRTFAAIFAIEGGDKTLMPDLSASVDVEIERVPGAIVVPRDAVAVRAGKPVVFVKDGNNYVERQVTIGARSEQEATIASGIAAGTLVRRGMAAGL